MSITKEIIKDKIYQKLDDINFIYFLSNLINMFDPYEIKNLKNDKAIKIYFKSKEKFYSKALEELKINTFAVIEKDLLEFEPGSSPKDIFDIFLFNYTAERNTLASFKNYFEKHDFRGQKRGSENVYESVVKIVCDIFNQFNIAFSAPVEEVNRYMERGNLKYFLKETIYLNSKAVEKKEKDSDSYLMILCLSEFGDFGDYSFCLTTYLFKNSLKNIYDIVESKNLKNLPDLIDEQTYRYLNILISHKKAMFDTSPSEIVLLI